MAIKIAVEDWDDFWPQAEPLMKEHHEELALFAKRPPFELDVERSALLANAGALLILGARDESDSLVGYCLWFLSFDLSAKDLLVASQGPWFVRESQRKGSLGIRLFEQSLIELRKREVKNVLAHHWLGGAGERLATYFARKGGEQLETIYSLWIGD